MPIVKEEDTVNLMEQALNDIPAPKKDDDPKQDKFVPHWKTEINMNLVADDNRHEFKRGMPPEISKNIVVDWESTTYLPIVYLSDFWLLKKHMVPLNETILDSTLNLTLNFYNLNTLWF
jgi:hypothetical protein